jgi:hypothetical protein
MSADGRRSWLDEWNENLSRGRAAPGKPPRLPGHFQVRAFNDCHLDHAGSYIIKGILAPRDFALGIVKLAVRRLARAAHL